MLDLQFSLHTIEYSKPQYIRKVIKEFDDKLWHDDLQKKNSLILYREYNYIIHDEQDLYDNSAAATTFFQSKNRNLESKHRNKTH